MWTGPICLAMTLCFICTAASASEYQWSVAVAPPAIPDGRPPCRAFMWIPHNCKQVRAVVVGQHNMLEEDILDDPQFRKSMADLGVAIVWISPMMDPPFDPAKSGERFNKMMKDLAIVSGYQELEFAPIAPIGHSACASYPWNFAAWAPQRTLAILSIHGDAPETPLAGFGHQSVHWPDDVLDGVPGLMVMAEYEWLDARWAPATVYRIAFPKTPIAMLAEPGEGHFAACDDLVRFCAMFIRKAVEQRLPALQDTPLDQPPKLNPIDPAKGWLVQRWRLRQARSIATAPAGQYSGDAVDAFWAFDREMAQAIQDYHAEMIGKSPQLLGFIQEGKLVPATPAHAMVSLNFLPNADGETFKLQPAFLDTVTDMGPGNNIEARNNHMRWTQLPAGAPIGHASGGGPIQLDRIEGPIERIDADTFRLSFERGTGFDTPVAWLCATHPGDDKYKSAVQQATMNIPRNTTGAGQTITFAPIPPQKIGADSIPLSATSSAGLPVHFFVREGPAEVDGSTLRIHPLPPRAKLPIEITVIAWQWGRSAAPGVKTAEPVTQTFQLMAAP